MQHRKYSVNHPNSIQSGKKHPQQNKAEKNAHENFVVQKISINFELWQQKLLSKGNSFIENTINSNLYMSP